MSIETVELDRTKPTEVIKISGWEPDNKRAAGTPEGLMERAARSLDHEAEVKAQRGRELPKDHPLKDSFEALAWTYRDHADRIRIQLAELTVDITRAVWRGKTREGESGIDLRKALD